MTKKIFTMPRSGDIKRMQKQKKREAERDRVRREALARLAAFDAEEERKTTDLKPSPIFYTLTSEIRGVLVYSSGISRPRPQITAHAKFLSFWQAHVFMTGSGQVTVERLVTGVRPMRFIASMIQISSKPQ